MFRSGLVALTVFLLVGLASLAVGLWLRADQAPEWLQPDTKGQPHPWMVEADCYSQLARDQRILNGQGLIQSHFKVENWPEGLVPSTTAPFDYVILLLYAPLKLFTKLPLDWAGVLVSPFLFVALIVFWMVFPSREFTRAGRAIFVAGAAALPALIWATAFGRPRHQSLILLLIALGWTAEYERWHLAVTPRRAWSVFAGVVWGLACWTSLFEPTFVVTLLVLFNLVVRRRESLPMLISFGTVMLLALILEGVHIFIPPPEFQVPLVNWLHTIAEVRGLNINGMLSRMTVILLLLPFVAWPLWSRENYNKTDRLIILLTIALLLFTFLQSRWAYYAALGELFILVRYFQIAPTRWTRVAVVAIFFLGLLYNNSAQLESAEAAKHNQPSPELEVIARSIDRPGGILAPWWLSPALLYFSGSPIVAGSSHCGISGIVASANFYNADSWAAAERILKERQVRWVVVFDDPAFVYPLLNTSRGILGLPLYTDDDRKAAIEATVAQTLFQDHYVPTWLRLRAVTPQMKLYQYIPVAER